MKLSSRVESIQPSMTMAISALAQKMKREGQHVIGFGAGEPDFDTPVPIKEAGIAAIQTGKTKYTEESGIPQLKEAICHKFYRDQRLSYTPDQIVISCGAKHSLYNLFLALLNPGDEALIPSPYWVSYPEQIRLAGGEPVFVKTDEADEFKVTPELLDRYITPRTKLLILNSPSNPTGMVYSQKELEALYPILIQNRCIVISDEIYEKLIYGDAPHVSIASLSEEMKALTVIVNGVSKAFAMTGWRIGYCAAPLNVAKAVSKIQGHSTSHPTTPSQWASIQALDGGEEAITLMKKEFNQRRQYMVDRLNRIPGVRCLEPKGAFYAFPNVSTWYGTRAKNGSVIQNSLDFCDFLLKEALVACVPGIAFGEDACVRLSYATDLKTIQEGLDRIEQWIAEIIKLNPVAKAKKL